MDGESAVKQEMTPEDIMLESMKLNSEPEGDKGLRPVQRLTYLAEHMLLMADELENRANELVEQAEQSPDNQILRRNIFTYQAGLHRGHALRIRNRVSEALQ
jgi:hypothetical protein